MAHNSIPSHEPSSVALALENAIALAVSRANAIVGDGTASPHGLAAADPDELADALTAANVLVSKLDDLRHRIALAGIDTRREPDDAEQEETDPEPDELRNEIDRAWNDAMQQLYAVRDLAHLLDVADDRAETVGYVIEREAERGVECMNALERLLVNARKQSRSSAEPDDDTSRAYAQGMRDGLWHAHEALKRAERGLQIDRMNADGSFPDQESGQ